MLFKFNSVSINLGKSCVGLKHKHYSCLFFMCSHFSNSTLFSYSVLEWFYTIFRQVHGDGALPGQGLNQETLLMSRLPHFEVGGSVHLVVNNQLAFTTPPERGRGTPYCTDVAKIIAAPVVHVNGDYPEVGINKL